MMYLQAAHRRCLTLRQPWKLQASNSSGHPRIGPGSASQQLRLGGDEGRSPRDDSLTLVVHGLWRRIHPPPVTRWALSNDRPYCEFFMRLRRPTRRDADHKPTMPAWRPL